MNVNFMIRGYWVFFYLIKTVTFQLKRGHYFFRTYQSQHMAAC